ncbi:MAG: ATP-binding protein [Planctomycetota bacterium]
MADTVRETELTKDQQIEILKKQLVEAQKLTALGELVGTTTHEFNNLLMTILNYAKMGIRHKDEPTRDKALNKILMASEKAAKVTNSILGMARNRSESMEPTDIAKLIDESMVLLEREMSKYRIHIDMQLDEVPKVAAIGNQIQQVLLNMLINARQAMDEGGDLRIRLSHNEGDQTVELQIRDNGRGMDQTQLRRIFDPYFSTKDGPDETGKGGTGLGLSACHDIIRNHNGRIRVESSVGKGTAFTIKLPAIIPNLASAPTERRMPITMSQHTSVATETVVR